MRSNRLTIAVREEKPLRILRDGKPQVLELVVPDSNP